MRRGKETTEAGRRKGRRNRANLTVILAAALFCLIVLCGAGYYGITVVNQVKSQESRTNGLVAEGNVKSGTLHDPAGRQAALDALVAEGMLTFSINATPSMENGSGMANLLIENPPENGNRFTVTILREDTGETLFQSGYLDPEQYIGEAPLDVELTAGVYACVANFDAYRISDNAYIGRGAARITLYVRN